MNLSDNEDDDEDEDIDTETYKDGDDLSETTDDMHNRKKGHHFQRQNESPRASIISTDTMQGTK